MRMAQYITTMDQKTHHNMIKLILKPSEIIPEDYNGKFINYYPAYSIKTYQVIKKINGRIDKKLILDFGVNAEYENGQIRAKN